MQSHGSHVLAVLAGGQFATEADGEDYIFLDRDPAWFSGVLAYLRGSRPVAPNPLQPDFTPQATSAPQLTAFMREARYYQIEGLHQLLMERFLLVSRALRPCVAVFTETDNVHGITLCVYDTGAQVWHSRHYQKERHCVVDQDGEVITTQFATCSRYGLIYVVGAFVHPVTKKRTVDRLDVRTGVWKCMASLDQTGLESKNCIEAAYLKDDALLVVSCFTDHVSRTMLHIIDLASGVATELPSTGNAPSQHFYATCMLQGRLIVAGGHDESGKKSRVSEYDLGEQAWCPLPFMHHRRDAVNCVEWNGRAAVVGGHDGARSMDVVEVFDPPTGSWSMLPSMQAPREQPVVVVVNGTLVVMGGWMAAEDDDGDDDEWTSMERYNGEAQRWETIGHMPFHIYTPANPAEVMLLPSSTLRDNFQFLA